FSEPMTTSTLSTAIIQAATAIAIKTDSDDSAGGEAALTLTNATGAWNAAKTVFTVTLNEATDGAFIGSSQYVSVTLVDSVTDLAGNAVTGGGANLGASTPVYTTGTVTMESTAPTVTAALVKVNNTTVKVTFSEPVDQTTAETAGNYALSGTGGLAGPTASAATLGANKTDVTLTVDDMSGLTDGQTVIVTVTNVTDLAGNTVNASNDEATYTCSVPTFAVTANSVNNGGDTIVVTFSEAMDPASLTQADVRGGTVLGIDYSDDAGNTSEAGITATNATAVWSGGNTILTITLDEATDGAFIPAGKYIGITLDGSVTSALLVAAGTSEVYTSGVVTAESTVPKINAIAMHDATSGGFGNDVGDALRITFSEPMADTDASLDASDLEALLTFAGGITDGTNFDCTALTIDFTSKTTLVITITDASTPSTNLITAGSGETADFGSITAHELEDLAGNDCDDVQGGSPLTIGTY
ncbi:MAG: Ig-like domain-containing protein, partial [Clostridia bacterium]|nr:Ig-like domain-containing protein [Clostridia bacterium]